jgi:N-dimethylarginine dimethylaminohydrolase
MYNYCPRDIMLAVDNTIIETPMSMRSRFLEPFAYKDLLISYMRSGARWISALKPRLADSIYNTIDPANFVVLDHESVFDAANCLRIGRDILYQVSDAGNRMGAEWLQSVVGSDCRVHAYDNLYDEAHIDTTITVLRPGLVLISPARISAENLPPIFKNWDVLVAPEPEDKGCSDFAFGSAWFYSMNLLTVNPRLAMVDMDQTELRKLFEQHGIDCILLQLRHARTTTSRSRA